MNGKSKCERRMTASSISVTGSSSTAKPPPNDLLEFYSLPDNFEVLRIVNGHSPPVSLRTIALYVSVASNESVKRDYAIQLQKLSRKRFDPFRRCDRLTLDSDRGSVVTTEGQMNFFRWLIQSGTWTFMVDNSASISASVAKCVRENTERMRAELESAPERGSKNGKQAPSGISTLAGRHVVYFD